VAPGRCQLTVKRTKDLNIKELTAVISRRSSATGDHITRSTASPVTICSQRRQQRLCTITVMSELRKYSYACTRILNNCCHSCASNYKAFWTTVGYTDYRPTQHLSHSRSSVNISKSGSSESHTQTSSSKPAV